MFGDEGDTPYDDDVTDDVTDDVVTDDVTDDAPPPAPSSRIDESTLPADLNTLTVDDLAQLARQRKIEGRSGMDKDELVEALLADIRRRPSTIR